MPSSDYQQGYRAGYKLAHQPRNPSPDFQAGYKAGVSAAARKLGLDSRHPQ